MSSQFLNFVSHNIIDGMIRQKNVYNSRLGQAEALRSGLQVSLGINKSRLINTTSSKLSNFLSHLNCDFSGLLHTIIVNTDIAHECFSKKDIPETLRETKKLFYNNAMAF